MTGRPGWPCRTFQVQNHRKPARCQATTVSGLTMASAERQSRQRCDRQIHKRRSPAVNFGRFAADLRSTPIWWRRARFSSSRAARESKIEGRVARHDLRKMSIGEDYDGQITLMLSEISRFSGGTMSNGTINRDLDVLRGVLKRAKRWHMMADDIRPLPVRQNVGRALAHDEKLRLLKLAAAKPEWQNARLAAILALNTTMRACEIRGLKWQNVDLIERVLTVRRNTTKSDAGERIIPLNSGAWAVILESRERSKLLFGSEPQPRWYVFPHAEGLLIARVKLRHEVRHPVIGL